MPSHSDLAFKCISGALNESRRYDNRAELFLWNALGGSTSREGTTLFQVATIQGVTSVYV